MMINIIFILLEIPMFIILKLKDILIFIFIFSFLFLIYYIQKPNIQEKIIQTPYYSIYIKAPKNIFKKSENNNILIDIYSNNGTNNYNGDYEFQSKSSTILFVIDSENNKKSREIEKNFTIDNEKSGYHEEIVFVTTDTKDKETIITFSSSKLYTDYNIHFKVKNDYFSQIQIILPLIGTVIPILTFLYKLINT